MCAPVCARFNGTGDYLARAHVMRLSIVDDAREINIMDETVWIINQGDAV